MYREAVESLDKETLIRLVLSQAETIAALTRQVEMLTTRVAALEAKLGLPPKTPGNSSTPPSQGHKPSEEAAVGPDSSFFRRLVSLRGRSTRIARRLWWQTELGFECRNTRRQHLDLPGQCGNRFRLRQNQADQCFLVERFNCFPIHPELE